MLNRTARAWIEDVRSLFAFSGECLTIHTAGGDGLVLELKNLSRFARRSAGRLDADTPLTTRKDFAADFEEKLRDTDGFEVPSELVQGPAFGDGADVDLEIGPSFAQGRRILADLEVLPAAPSHGGSDFGLRGR